VEVGGRIPEGGPQGKEERPANQLERSVSTILLWAPMVSLRLSEKSLWGRVLGRKDKASIAGVPDKMAVLLFMFGEVTSFVSLV